MEKYMYKYRKDIMLLYSSQIMIMCSFYLKCIDDKIFIFKLKQKVKSKSLDSIGHLFISGTL